jgi:putative hydroxymethylpyrimidine transport system substrate-binding protein
MKKYVVILLLLVAQIVYAQPLKKVTVILDWFVNPDHAPLFVAQQQGYFKQQGLQVNIVAPANPNDGPKLVASGQADLTISYLPALLQQVEQGLPLVQVGVLFPMQLNVIAVLKNGPIKSIKDLKGKTIASSASSVDQAMLGAVLKHNGLSLSDVTIIDTNYNLVQALLTHRAAAVSGIMRNFEPIEMQLAGQPARLFYPEKNGVPEFPSEIWLANRDQAHKPWVKQFMHAIVLGTRYLQQHPEQSWQMFAKNHPELNNTLNHKAWMITYKLFAQQPRDFNPKAYHAFATFMVRQGLIKSVPKLAEYTA